MLRNGRLLLILRGCCQKPKSSLKAPKLDSRGCHMQEMGTSSKLRLPSSWVRLELAGFQIVLGRH